MNQTKTQVHIRMLIRRDMPTVLELEQQCFEFSWTEEDFLWCLRERNCMGMVAEDDRGQILGYMFYELKETTLHILNFAVRTSARRNGVGSQMVRRLIDKLSNQRRQELFCVIRERNLIAQKFFRQMGFFCWGVLRKHYEDSDDDGYKFSYYLGW